MTDASQVKNGRLGPFQLDRRSRHKDKDRDDLLGNDLGRVYEAHNVHTGAPALVVIPGQHVGWEPEESWQVRASSHAEPPYLTLEVEQAPASGRLTPLVDMLDLLTCAVERMEPSEESRAHLAGGPVPLLKRWAGRWRRLPRSRRQGLAAREPEPRAVQP